MSHSIDSAHLFQLEMYNDQTVDASDLSSSTISLNSTTSCTTSYNSTRSSIRASSSFSSIGSKYQPKLITSATSNTLTAIINFDVGQGIFVGAAVAAMDNKLEK